MSQQGRLIVFEGPDDVGKTTLAEALVEALKRRRIDAMYYAFPGAEPNTLGAHVYRLHHDIQGVVGGPVTPLALQTLHVAAHLDAIERVIKPVLERGTTVVLDRYWWSTQIYGWASDISFMSLGRLIALEKELWGDLRPSKLFCVMADRPRSSYQGDPEYWRKIYQGYQVMLQAHADDPMVRVIGNNGTIESALHDIMQQL